MSLRVVFELLGLTPDADERAVKRAYAAKLKTTRPDEDPEGFQRLNEAYQAALAWARSGPHPDEGDEDDGYENEDGTGASSTDTVMQATTADRTQAADAQDARAQRTSEEPATPFDPDAFLERCFALALHSRDGELRAWLDAQPVLWSLARKSQIGAWLLQEMHRRQPPIPPSRFDALLDYFGLTDLRSGYDAYHLQRLRHRLQLTWELRTTQLRALAERTADGGSSLVSAMRQTERILRQVSRPLSWPQALVAALMPMYPTTVRRFLHRLDHGDLDDLPPPIDADQIAFWNAAGDRSRFTRERWGVGIARVLTYAAIAALLHAGFSAMAGSSVLKVSTPAVAMGGLVLMATAWLSWIGHDAFTTWQSRHDGYDEPRPWLRRFAIPVLVLSGCALIWGLPAHGWAGAVGGLALVYAVTGAWARHRARSGPPLGPWLGYWRTLALFAAVRVIGRTQGLMDNGDTLLAISGIALFIWAKDLWRQRRSGND